MLEREVKIGSVYKHFKGNLYFVEDIAIGSEDDIPYVVYRALYGEHLLYIRPVEMFLSEMDREKYPNVEQQYRFEEEEIESVAPQFKA